MEATRVAVVTGAGQGLGRATALALHAAGIRVAAVGRTKAKLDETVAEMGEAGAAVAADLSDPDQVRAAFKAVAARFGGIDILVNCAAEYGAFRLDEATDQQITNVIAQSLTSTIFCMRDVIPFMRQRGAGDIVNISSQSAVLPQPFHTVYGAAKAGVETVSQGLRYELKGEDFRIMVCQIGIVAESVLKIEPALRDRVRAALRETGVGSMFAWPGTPADGIAAAIVHAVTAPRSVYIQNITLRGTDVAPDPASG